MKNNEFDQDRDFQILHEKYKLVSTEQPPEEVDANILQAAHQAVNFHKQVQNNVDHKQQKEWLTKRTWYVPMSYVAIMVLSLSVVLKLAFEPDTSEFEDALAEAPGFVEKGQGGAKEIALPEMGVPQRQNATVEISRDSQEQALSSIADVKVKAKKQARAGKIINHQNDIAPLLAPGKQGVKSLASGAIMSKREVASSSIPQIASTESAADAAIMDFELNEFSRVKNHQKIEMDKLIKLFQNRQFKKLRSALKGYRKDYPLNVSEEALPQALLDLESRWKAEDISKPLDKK